MAKDRRTGKLAVILHADIAGSTALVQQDEHLAHERIQDTFARFADTVKLYSGRLLELRGDALLAEFDRPSEAVAATLAFQQDQKRFLQSIGDDLKPGVRVGIAMGEIVVADATATGAGVVLAQRVEQLAEEGSLCITAAIHEALSRRLPFEFEDLGEKDLKGFDYPVRVYRVRMRPNTRIPAPAELNRPDGSRAPAWIKPVAIALAPLFLIGAVYWHQYRQLSEPPPNSASIDRKHSIAVLPFTNLSDDPAQEYFADGMAEDLITDLSKISSLFVIARNSSFAYKGKQTRVQQIAADLGVNYILEGSVRRAGDQLRINAQLIDAGSGGHLWAERYDGSFKDIFALQDRVTARIVDALSLKLTAQDRSNLEAAGTTNAEAHDAYLQGLSFYLRKTPDDNARAVEPLKRALELDPGYKRAHATLAKVYLRGIDVEYSYALGIYFRKATFFAYQSLARIEGANLVEAHVVRAQMARLKHQIGVALDQAERALALSPNDVDALRAKAQALVFSGDYRGAREAARRAMRLDPVVIAEPLNSIGLSYFAEGDYGSAADYGERARQSDPETNSHNLLLAAAYGKLGNTEKASEHWSRYKKNLRGGKIWIALAVSFFPFSDDKILQRLADGFEAAGGVERPPARYLKFNRETRLSGAEIKSLLFGRKIEGNEYFRGNAWEQTRSSSGRVRHSGVSIHSGFKDIVEEADSWIEGDRLCHLWFHDSGNATICYLIFEDTARGPGHYYMFTDEAPHPFRLQD